LTALKRGLHQVILVLLLGRDAARLSQERLSCVPGAVFSGSMDGHIRAFSTEDGHLLWDFDTAHGFPTINGVPAHGGSLDGAGPVIVDGMV
jgi:outer membrane protein assembly factor BamB